MSVKTLDILSLSIQMAQREAPKLTIRRNLKSLEFSEDALFKMFQESEKELSSIEGKAASVSCEIMIEMTKRVVANLSNTTLKAASYYKAQWESLNGEKLRLIEEKDSIFNELQEGRKRYQSYISQSEELERSRENVERQINEYLQEILSAEREMAEINEKAKKLKKWCWVPGYNIYLLIDKEGAESHIKSYQCKYENAIRMRRELEEQEYQLIETIRQLEGMENETKNMIENNENKMKECCIRLDTAKAKSLKASDASLIFSITHSSLDSIEVCAEDEQSVKEKVLEIIKAVKSAMQYNTVEVFL